MRCDRSTRRPLWAFLALALATACGQSPGPSGLMTGWGQVTHPLEGNGVLTYALSIEPALLGGLMANPLQTQWVPAQLAVGDRPLGPVGVRWADSPSRLKACFRNGKQICAKVSLAVKLMSADPAHAFFGLGQLNFHAMATDASLLRERMAAELFRRMDVEAARVAHGFVTINGEARGLFAVVENLDDRFLEDRWPDEGSGNLYRDLWPTSASESEYTAALLTNQQAPNHQVLTAFATQLGAKTADLEGLMSSYLDVQQVMRYLAVDRVINDYDGVTAFYCGVPGQACANHNFLWYQHPIEGRFVWIPADASSGFQLRTPFDELADWTIKPANCEPQEISDAVGLVMPPGCDPIFVGLAKAPAAYRAALDELLVVWDEGALPERLASWAAEIEPAVAHDEFGPGLVAWRAEVATLQNTLRALRERLLGLREARDAGRFGLSTPGSTDFETVSDLAFARDVAVETNPGSGASVRLADDDARVGQRAVHFDFELANGATKDIEVDTPAAQLRLPFATNPAGLAGLTRLQVRMAADHVRSVRIELDSPRYGDDPDRPDRWGWVVPISQLDRAFTLDLAGLNLAPDALGSRITKQQALRSATGLTFRPQPRGLDHDGLLPAGTTDRGFLRIDQLVIDTAAPSPIGSNPKSAALFDEDRIVDLNLSFPPGAWESLLTLTGPAAQRWVPCSLQALGLPATEATCRRKGDPEDWTLEKKPQISVRFNQNDKAGRLFGLRRINLEAFAGTVAPIRDRLGMWLMRAAGIDAPRVNHVRVFKDGALLGLYQNIEVLDREFLEDHFGDDAGGNLWKGGEHLETSQKVMDAERLLALQRLIAAEPLAGDHTRWAERLAGRIDLAQVSREMAVESALGTVDNFGNGGPNFAYYEHPRRGFMVLPWDLDRVFTVAPANANPFDYRGLSGAPNKLHLLLNQIPAWRAEYAANLLEIRDQLLARMPAKIDAICAQIAPALAEEARSMADAAAFAADCAAVKQQVRQRIAALGKLLGP
jgi:spore coat protein CotH